MGLLWDMLVDEDDFGRRIQKGIENSKIIIEINRKIDMPLLVDPSDEIKRQFEAFLRDYDLQTLRQEVADLRQKIYEESGRSQAESDKRQESRMKGIEARLQDLESKSFASTDALLDDWKREREGLKGELAGQKQEIEYLKGTLGRQAQELASLKSAINDRMRENLALKRQADQSKQRMAVLEQQNAAQAQALAALKSRMGEIENGLKKASLRSESKESASAPSSESQEKATISPAPSWIAAFSLPKPEMSQAFFHGNGEEVKAKLAQSIREMGVLVSYLSRSQIAEPARSSFLKNFRWCMEALTKFHDKFDFADCDIEELSEEITEKFFKIISESLLDNVMVAIYRGGKAAAGYKELLQKVNLYLARHGIYTMDLLPGSKLEDEMISSIETPICKATSVAADHGKIDEVELLPYFMDYEDDEGSLDTVRKRGRIICLKYGV